MTDVIYNFAAVDRDVGIDLDCLVTLSYSPTSCLSRSSSSLDALDATFILGEFKAQDIASQAYDWFMGQHNVSIDRDSLESFLVAIQTYSVTRFISVYIDIVSKQLRHTVVSDD